MNKLANKMKTYASGVKARAVLVFAVLTALVVGSTAAMASAQTTTTVYNPSSDISNFGSSTLGAIPGDLAGVWPELAAIAVLFFGVFFILGLVKKRGRVG